MTTTKAKMDQVGDRRAEARLAAKHCAVSVMGFLVDAGVLQAGLRLGLEPAWARVISLACAMQATFLLNGYVVFQRLNCGPGRFVRCWAGYMAANGFGNLCNYWIFVSLVSLHGLPPYWPIISAPACALAIASVAAWAINYGCTRFLVFGSSVGLINGRLRAVYRAHRARGRSAARREPVSPG